MIASDTRKIDFFGGLHGRFLELVVNCWIDQNKFDFELYNQFSKTGSCDIRLDDRTYQPITRSRHYSWMNLEFDDNDFVIRIVPEKDDLLIAITNSFERAGGPDHALDLHNLEIDTYQKMSCSPKYKNFLDVLIKNHGMSEHYPRAVLRKYFFSMFDDQTCGLDMFQNWLPCKNYHNFQFSCFFDLSKFLEGLQEIAYFFQMKFAVDDRLVKLHGEFLSRNQGYHSKIKCQHIINAILQRQSMQTNLNIIEEAWINYRISRMFNHYDVDQLNTNYYPKDTIEIYNALPTTLGQGSVC